MGRLYQMERGPDGSLVESYIEDIARSLFLQFEGNAGNYVVNAYLVHNPDGGLAEYISKLSITFTLGGGKKEVREIPGDRIPEDEIVNFLMKRLEMYRNSGITSVTYEQILGPGKISKVYHAFFGENGKVKVVVKSNIPQVEGTRTYTLDGIKNKPHFFYIGIGNNEQIKDSKKSK